MSFFYVVYYAVVLHKSMEFHAIGASVVKLTPTLHCQGVDLLA